jgi:hypothetical protein
MPTDTVSSYCDVTKPRHAVRKTDQSARSLTSSNQGDEDGYCAGEGVSASLARLSKAVSGAPFLGQSVAEVRSGGFLGLLGVLFRRCLRRTRSRSRVVARPVRSLPVYECVEDSWSGLLDDVARCGSDHSVELDFSQMEHRWERIWLSVLLSELGKCTTSLVYVKNWQHLFLSLDRSPEQCLPCWLRPDQEWREPMYNLRKTFEEWNDRAAKRERRNMSAVSAGVWRGSRSAGVVTIAVTIGLCVAIVL